MYQSTIFAIMLANVLMMAHQQQLKQYYAATMCHNQKTKEIKVVPNLTGKFQGHGGGPPCPSCSDKINNNNS